MLDRRPATDHDTAYPTLKGLLAGLGAGMLGALLLGGCSDAVVDTAPNGGEGTQPQPVRPPGEPPLPPPVEPQTPIKGKIKPVEPARPEVPLEGEAIAPEPVEPPAAVKGIIVAPEPARPEVPKLEGDVAAPAP